MIQTTCECGKGVRVHEELAGQEITCLRCGRTVVIPVPENCARAPKKSETAPAALPAPVTPAPRESARDYLYWLLIFAFVPLVLELGTPREAVNFQRRLDETLSKAPAPTRERAQEVIKRIQRGHASPDELFVLMPGGRLLGALLPRHTDLHWAFAAASALVFWLLIGSCFPGTRTGYLELLCVGIFTGTLGVAIVLSLHSLPFIGELLWLCLASQQSSSDFVVVLTAFTLGVGLVEEIGKLIPVLWFFRKRGEISWRRACLWGLASGAGFGVAEGVIYSATMYNGIGGLESYLVRFFSCVVLHAVWTATAALAVFHHQDLLNQLLRPALSKDGPPPRDRLPRHKDALLRTLETPALDQGFAWVLAALKVVAGVMLLHGLYDAALAVGLPIVALATAVVSFGWLVWQVEAARQQEAPAPDS